jgi:hypothetical protein
LAYAAIKSLYIHKNFMISLLLVRFHNRVLLVIPARGTPRPDGDYDLLVISDQIRDYDEVYRAIVGCGLPCDVVPCLVDAWKDADKDSGGVLREARDEGVILYAGAPGPGSTLDIRIRPSRLFRHPAERDSAQVV